MRSAILVAAVLVAGCGSFPLGRTVPPLTKTAEQHQLDQLTCKDQAFQSANSSERQAGNFLMGLTIVGTPIAWEIEKKHQREVFKNCMEARGYTVIPPP